jgi:hypothetical protein
MLPYNPNTSLHMCRVHGLLTFTALAQVLLKIVGTCADIHSNVVAQNKLPVSYMSGEYFKSRLNDRVPLAGNPAAAQAAASQPPVM